MSVLRKFERGVTSLVLVMFSTLLLITMTVGFMQLMVSEQTRSNDNELSQGAYDSAMAGVEDGKRALAACQSAGPSSAQCAALDIHDCRLPVRLNLVNLTNGEMYIKTNSNGGVEYQQAYTCVNIYRDTNDYRGTLMTHDSQALIPIRSQAPFTRIQVYWRIAGSTAATNLGLPSSLSLPAYGSSTWPLSKPALLRAQLIQSSTATPIDQTLFDDNGNGHTIYLYPVTGGLASTLQFASDSRRSGSLMPSPVSCGVLPVYDGYNCSATIELPDPIGGNANNRSAYLRLLATYNSADFMVRMINSAGDIVQFSNVQPRIDSTGRANDVFRRVDARVEMVDPNDASLYPRATVDVSHNFCKTFGVSALPSYYTPGACSPTGP